MGELEKSHETSVGSVYLHMGDGGVTLEILDNSMRGPVIKITSSFWGNVLSTLTLTTTWEGLNALKNLFEAASIRDYSEEAIHAGRPLCRYTVDENEAVLKEEPSAKQNRSSDEDLITF